MKASSGSRKGSDFEVGHAVLASQCSLRMNLQNQWASTVLKEFPEIASCDLWQLVKDQENERYADWWKGESVSFNYLESVPLGRKVAESVSQALGQGGEINPPSVHQPARPLNGSR